MVYFLFFIAGGLFFTGLYIGISLIVYKRTVNKRRADLKNLVDSMKNEFEDLKKKSKSSDGIKDRMRRVREITERQLELRAEIEFPQRSGLDGKHKNMLVSEAKTLEDEKFALLNAILADGHDPLVSSIGENGETQEMRLSEFIATSGYKTSSTVPEQTVRPNLPPNARQVGKFVVYSNPGDDEEGTNN